MEGAVPGLKIIEQYKRLGASCDYDRERFTMDEVYVRAVYKVFVVSLSTRATSTATTTW